MAVFDPHRASLHNILNIQLDNNNAVSSASKSDEKLHNKKSSVYLKKMTDSNVLKNDLGEKRGSQEIIYSRKGRGVCVS